MNPSGSRFVSLRLPAQIPVRKRVAKHGFTLIEVMLGLMIMAVVMAGVLTATARISTLAVNAQSTARCNALLNSTVEELRGLSYEQLETRLTEGQTSGTISAASSAGNYPITWTIANTATGDDLQRVKVTVSWQRGEVVNELTAVTYFYRYGIANR